MQIMNINETNLELLEKDYTYSTIDFLWLRENKKRFILFTAVKLWPNEFPAPEIIEEEAFPVNKKEKIWLYHKRITLTAEEGIEWYKKAVKNEPLEILANERPAAFEGVIRQSVSEWPFFYLSGDIPFAYGEVVRAHSLFDLKVHSVKGDIFKKGGISEWINYKAGFDILKYEEYVGSVNIIAFNPLYRKIKQTLIHEKENDSIVYGTEVRKGHVPKLNILSVNKHPKGFSYIHKFLLDANSVKIKYPGKIEETGFIVECDERGVLDFHKPTAFMESVNINVSMSYGEKVIEYPDKNYSKVEGSYSVPLSTETSSSFAGKESGEDDINTKLRRIHNKRKEEEQRRSSEHHNLHGNDKIISDHIRKIIGSARDRVVVIDPYISAREIRKYVLAAKNNITSVTVVTSALIMNEKIKKNTLKIEGGIISFLNGIFRRNRNLRQKDMLFKDMQTITKEISSLEIKVMSGKSPVFHDRFIIADNDLWMIGTSLGSVGEKRISIMTKIAYPEKLIDVFMKECGGLPLFLEWYTNEKQ